MASLTDPPLSTRVEPADDAEFNRIESATRNLFTENLITALRRLQTTRAPPKRRTSYQLYLEGYFEFQNDIEDIRSLSPTPTLSPTYTSSCPQTGDNATDSNSEDEQSTTATTLTIHTPSTPLSECENEPRVLVHTSSWETELERSTSMTTMKGRKRRCDHDDSITESISDNFQTTKSQLAAKINLWQFDGSDGRPKRAHKRQKVS